MKLQGNKIFIKILKEDRDRTERISITRKDGTTADILLSLPSYQNLHQYDYSVRHGVVIDIAESVTHIQPGDFVIFMPQIDYDDKYFVRNEADGKVVWADATTTFHTEDRIVYGYPQGKEHRQLVWANGDINELSLIVAIVRGETLIPNIPYVFCEPEEAPKPIDLSDVVRGNELIDSPIMQLSSSGLWAPTIQEIKPKDVLERTVLSSSDPSLLSGIRILVKEESEFVYNIFGRKLCVVYSMDVLAELT